LFGEERLIDTLEGMDLRDYFAGQVLVGMFANPTLVPAIKELELAKMAYKVAEMMMQVRKQ
jgi:hypothetical protein